MGGGGGAAQAGPTERKHGRRHPENERLTPASLLPHNPDENNLVEQQRGAGASSGSSATVTRTTLFPAYRRLIIPMLRIPCFQESGAPESETGSAEQALAVFPVVIGYD